VAYPTGVDFRPTGQTMGLQPINETSTTQKHPLGMVVEATDTTYGTGSFVYLKGVASTDAGDLVCYDQKNGDTVRTIAGDPGVVGPCAVSMSANVASQYGWYQIAGAGPVKGATVLTDVAMYLTSTAGQVDDTVVAGSKIDGMSSRAATSGGFVTVQLDHPSVTGSVSSASTDSVATALALTTTPGGASLVGVYDAGTFYTGTTVEACLAEAATKATINKLTLVVGAEGDVAANAIEIAGTVEDLAGTDAAAAKQVFIQSLAVTDDKGDLAAAGTPVGTLKKAVNPAAGPNSLWMETTAAGLFSFRVSNDVAEETIVTICVDGGITKTVKLTFA
jgi:hypothetical protein